MRNTLLIVVAIALLISCASNGTKPPDTSPWEDFGYEGMAAKINRLAGTTSLNCGIRNNIEENDPVNRHMSQGDSLACVRAAVADGRPFRYGSIRIPEDSFLFDALVLSEQGEYWLIRFDSMIDRSDSKHFIKRCKSVNMHYSPLRYEGVDCQPETTEVWLSDIPEQQ